MEPEQIGLGLLRVTNAVLWTVLAVQIWTADKPVFPLVRTTVMAVVVVGMWCLAVGILAGTVLPAETIRSMYTVFTAFAGVIALVLVIAPLRAGDD